MARSHAETPEPGDPRSDSKTRTEVSNYRILIVGGGIGGMSSAIALANKGHQIDLIERDEDWRALGAGLTLNGASMRVLDNLGVLDAVLEQGFGAAGTANVYIADGTKIVSSDRSRQYGPRVPNMGGIMRPVLHEILKAKVLSLPVHARSGVTFTTLSQADGKVSVSFSDGSSGVYDLVIGADGLFSQVRKTVLPDAPVPAPTGQGCFRAVIARPKDQDIATIYVGKTIKTGYTPVSQEHMYLFALVPMPGNPFLPPETWPEELQNYLSEFGGEIATIRDEQLGDHSLINYRPLEGILLESDWYVGHVLLIGDAAHATTPHVAYGAGLAIEDGVVIAEEIAKHETINEALAAFQARRFERCATVVRGSKQVGELEMAGKMDEAGHVFEGLLVKLRGAV